MSIYGELDQELREIADNEKEYEIFKEQIILHFEGKLFDYELNKKVLVTLIKWENENTKRR